MRRSTVTPPVPAHLELRSTEPRVEAGSHFHTTFAKGPRITVPLLLKAVPSGDPDRMALGLSRRRLRQPQEVCGASLPSFDSVGVATGRVVETLTPSAVMAQAWSVIALALS